MRGYNIKHRQTPSNTARVHRGNPQHEVAVEHAGFYLRWLYLHLTTWHLGAPQHDVAVKHAGHRLDDGPAPDGVGVVRDGSLRLLLSCLVQPVGSSHGVNSTVQTARCAGIEGAKAGGSAVFRGPAQAQCQLQT